MEAVSYGTKVWLADLLLAGWMGSVVEHRPIERHVHLRLVDDLEDVVQTVTQPARVGVLCERDGSGIFIPCSDAAEARDLLADALLESGL